LRSSIQRDERHDEHAGQRLRCRLAKSPARPAAYDRAKRDRAGSLLSGDIGLCVGLTNKPAPTTCATSWISSRPIMYAFDIRKAKRWNSIG